MRSLLDRVRALPPRQLDGLLATLVLVDGAVEVLLLSRLEGGRLLVGFGVAALIALAVFLRRQLPVTAIALGWSGMLVADQVGRELIDNVAGPYFANMLVT